MQKKLKLLNLNSYKKNVEVPKFPSLTDAAIENILIVF